MNYRDWQFLLVIAEVKNMTAAASKLYITQPALTYRLKNIEKELSATLFIRTPKGLLLTPEGESAVHYAKIVLKEFDVIKTKISNMSGSVQGTLRLGLSLNFARRKLAGILSTFCKLYPDVELSIKTELSSQTKMDLDNDDIAVAIVRGEHVWSEFKHLIAVEPIYLVSNYELPLKSLPKIPYIMYDADSSLNMIVANWWSEIYSSPPTVTMQINDADTCLHLASLGLGYTIIPSMNVQDIDTSQLKILPLFLKNKEPLERKTYIMCRNSSMQLPAVSKFIEHVVNLKDKI